MLEVQQQQQQQHHHRQQHRAPSSSSSYSEHQQHQHQQTAHGVGRKERLARVCTARTSARRFPVAPGIERRAPRKSIKEEQCSRITTPLTLPPSIPSQLPRWKLRSMWELASILNFLHIFRPLLNINVEFSAEELETALITPNSTLGDIHVPLLKETLQWDAKEKLEVRGAERTWCDAMKVIPPVTRMALGHATWVTVLCRKLRDWWHWVAEGDIPIVASHGEEIQAYKTLDPGTRAIILKALCDIRVEQEDIRNYIDDSIKHGVQLSAFCNERIGGDSHGTSYWYEDDPVIGHRLYREIRRVEFKKVKIRGPIALPAVSCQWETVAANFDEFQEVSEKLLSSKNRTEAALGKRLKFDILPEVEKIQKRKARALKKQHRQAVLLDSFLSADGLPSGRSLRDRKPVTYTFDDFDRSINEAIKITKRRQTSPEPVVQREVIPKQEVSTNGKWHSPSQMSQQISNETLSPKSTDYEETDGEHIFGPLDRSNRRRQRPQRYSEKEFVEAISDNELGFDSDDDIVGEAVYDEEYLRNRKQRKLSSSSEGDEEYRWDPDENAEEEEEDSLSINSEETEEAPRRSKKLPARTSRNSRREMKLRSVDELQSGGGLRRSKRATRTHIDYRQYEMSDSEPDYSENPDKPDNSNTSVDQQLHSDASDSTSNYSMVSQDSDDSEAEEEEVVDSGEGRKDDIEPPPSSAYGEYIKKEHKQNSVEKAENSSPVREAEGMRKRRFLDLNELAPLTGFDDGPTNMMIKDEDVNKY